MSAVLKSIVVILKHFYKWSKLGSGPWNMTLFWSITLMSWANKVSFPCGVWMRNTKGPHAREAGCGAEQVGKFQRERSFPMGCENKGDPLFSSKDGQTLSIEGQIGNILGLVGHRVSHNHSTLSKLYCGGWVPTEHYLWTLKHNSSSVIISSLLIFFSSIQKCTNYS